MNYARDDQKKICLFFIPLLYFSLTPLMLHAGEYLSLNQAIDEARKSNPEILAAKHAYEAATAKIPQAGSLKDPEFAVEYDKINADRMLTGDPMKMYALSQEIPFPTKLYLRAKIASRLAKMEFENFSTKEREVVAKVKNAYAELFYIYKSIDVVNENNDILKQYYEVATAQYAAAKTSQSDVIKAQLEISKNENELILLQQKKVVAQSKLNVLLDKNIGTEIKINLPEMKPESLKPLHVYCLIAKEKNPQLKAYRYAIERGEEAYKLSLHEPIPDVTLRFKQMFGDPESWAGMIGVTIPLWFFQKQAFGIAEMKSELNQVNAEYKAKENSVFFDIKEAHARAEANMKLMKLYETTFIPQAQEVVNTSLKGYQSQKESFFILLENQKMLIDYKREYYKTVSDMMSALADLEYTIGTDLNSKE